MNLNVIYYVCGEPSLANPPRPLGWIIPAPYTGCPVPIGYREEVAQTLTEVDMVEKKLQQQAREEWEAEEERDYEVFYARRKEIRSNLLNTSRSAECNQRMKDLIDAWMNLRSDHPKKKYYAEAINGYFWARHNDIPKDRESDEEKVSLDRINF